MRIKSSLILILILILYINNIYSQGQSYKYSLWKNPSYFRGFNVIAEQNLTLKDFEDLKALGATIAHINVYGFLDTMPPYLLVQKHITEIDKLVNFCKVAKLNYSLTVRQGPGRRDVYWEGEKLVSKSTIWTNSEEQALYASMIKNMVERYCSDSLFVGISPILEPNPLFDTLYFTPEMLKQMLLEKNINVNKIYRIIIDSIRKIDKTLPILVQNVAYSCPEFFKIMEPVDDEYIVYEFHNYRPSEYVNETEPNKRVYPGKFVSINNLSIEYHDSSFFQNNIFRYIKEFENKTKAPIFLGEFGLLTEQIGGIQFIEDVSNICLQNGWHLAYWIWRGGGGWDFEKMDAGYIETVKEIFTKWTSVPDEKIDFEKVEMKTLILLSNNQISISCPSNTTISIFDFNGRLIEKYVEKDKSDFRLDIQNLSTGLYFVICNTNDKVFIKYFLKL